MGKMEKIDVQKYGRAKDCAARYGVATCTWWRWYKQGKLPDPIKISTRATVWNFADVEKHLTGKQIKDGELV